MSFTLRARLSVALVACLACTYGTATGAAPTNERGVVLPNAADAKPAAESSRPAAVLVGMGKRTQARSPQVAGSAALQRDKSSAAHALPMVPPSKP